MTVSAKYLSCITFALTLEQRYVSETYSSVTDMTSNSYIRNVLKKL